MKSLPNQPSADAWTAAVALLERWQERGARADLLLEEAARKASDELGSEHRARCQHLFFGALRHYGRLEAAIRARVRRLPRARLRSVLLIAGFELLDTGAVPVEAGQAAKVVHHAVAQAKHLLSAPEARLVNAVLRKLAADPGLHGASPEAGSGSPELARYFSHPEWLVRRWQAQFGAEAALALLKWNQTPPPVYGRWRGPGDRPIWLQATDWADFYVVPAGHWPEVGRLLAEGVLYLQDPATLLAVDLLNPQSGETVLDLCAAPGGKSLLLADRLDACRGRTGTDVNPGRVVTVDLPDDRRIARLKENLAKARSVDVALVQADVLRLTPRLFKEHGLPAAYAAVLLDVPCSNTGVMRHRVDVKWRLREADIAKHAAQQLALLDAAVRFVAPGGRLVYSTCSLEAEENERVVETFLRSSRGRFHLERTSLSRPWETGCDGAAAFLLRRE